MLSFTSDYSRGLDTHSVEWGERKKGVCMRGGGQRRLGDNNVKIVLPPF